MQAYLAAMEQLVKEGNEKGDRTGTGTRSLFSHQIRFDLRKGFPLVTTKEVFTRGIIAELLWMLAGETNIKTLLDQNVHIWDEWADENGDLGPVYGAQWRSWKGADGETIDQIAWVVEAIKNTPNSRRLIVSAWNVAELEDMALPPCHLLFQFYVVDGFLDCQLFQRSADWFLGVPFNIASYALLTMMIAQVCGLTPRYFIHTFGDYHLYENHLEQAQLQLSREPRALPTMKIDPAKDIFSFTPEHFHLTGYDPHPKIKGAVSV